MSTLAGRIEERVGGRRTAVVGVGNRLRGDDGAGSRIAERLRAAGHALAIDAETVPENFLDALLAAAPEQVLFVDAVDHGAAPGECCLVTVAELAGRASSTHAPSLRLLAGILEGRGTSCWVLGIQPGTTEVGAGPSPAVARAIDEIVGALARAAGARVGAAGARPGPTAPRPGPTAPRPGPTIAARAAVPMTIAPAPEMAGGSGPAGGARRG
jgi:hydrogenase maturation protease